MSGSAATLVNVFQGQAHVHVHGFTGQHRSRPQRTWAHTKPATPIPSSGIQTHAPPAGSQGCWCRCRRPCLLRRLQKECQGRRLPATVFRFCGDEDKQAREIKSACILVNRVLRCSIVGIGGSGVCVCVCAVGALVTWCSHTGGWHQCNTAS